MKNTKHIETFVSWMKAKRMSENTISTYKAFIEKFILYVDCDLSRISKSMIQDYLFSIPKCFSDSYHDQNISSIKLFFKVCKGVKLDVVILPRPKRTKFIPNVLEEDEMASVIFNTENLKHMTILFVAYSNGLRISELLKLTLFDVRTKCANPHLIIRDSKNRTSANVYMDSNCVEMIKKYYRTYHPTKFLFEGQKGGPYSKTSVGNILKAALKRERINKKIRVHDLRHTMAYHMLLNGTDIYHLSKFLRHKSVKTTEEYYAHIQTQDLHLKRPTLLSKKYTQRTAV